MKSAWKLAAAAVAVVMALSVGACTHSFGTQFATPSDTTLILGKTTRDQVIALYGKPMSQREITESGSAGDASRTPSDFDPASPPGTRTILSYSYAEANAPIAGGAVASKTMVVMFFNDVLVARSFSSSFQDSSTNFDDSKVPDLKKGALTKSDVIAAVGAPPGELIYPAIRNPNDSAFLYGFRTIEGTNTVTKFLSVLFDEGGHVKDVRFTRSTDPLPVVPAPRVVTVPIFIK